MPTEESPETLSELVNIFVGLANPLLIVLAGLSLFVFFWGLVKFIAKAGDTKTHEDGRSLMIWGLIALFVMVSFMGIIRFFYNDLGLTEFGFPKLPDGSGSSE